MDKLKKRIGREVESLADDLFAVSDFLLANPEIAYQEFNSTLAILSEPKCSKSDV